MRRRFKVVRPSAESQLMRRNGIDHANGMMTPPATEPVISSSSGSNKQFRAQFNIKVIKSYFTETGGNYTPIDPSALNVNLQVPLPYFLFGYNDSQSGYKGLINNNPVSTTDWTIGVPFVFGRDGSTVTPALQTSVTATLQRGDLVIPFTSALPGGGTTTLAIVVVRSNTVGYGTLLNSLVSDTFAINLIRYIVEDETAENLSQFSNDINLFGISLFGKITSDSYSPNASKTPEQEQRNIIDIDIAQNMNKERALAGYINHNVNTFDWSIFVSYFDKFGG